MPTDRTLRPGGWCCRCHAIGDVFEGADLPMWCTKCAGEWMQAQPADLPDIDTVIRNHTVRVLERCGGSKAKAAEMLGVVSKTIYNWLNKWEEQDRRDVLPGPGLGEMDEAA
jgi:hypothetical protein